MQIACFKCKLHIACRAWSPRADVLVAAEDVGRVPVAFEGGQAVVLGGAVGAADGGLVELAQVVDVVDRGGEGAQGGHGLAAQATRAGSSAGSSQTASVISQRAASRPLKAVASSGTRPKAPPSDSSPTPQSGPGASASRAPIWSTASVARASSSRPFQ